MIGATGCCLPNAFGNLAAASDIPVSCSLLVLGPTLVIVMDPTPVTVLDSATPVSSDTSHLADQSS